MPMAPPHMERQDLPLSKTALFASSMYLRTITGNGVSHVVLFPDLFL